MILLAQNAKGNSSAGTTINRANALIKELIRVRS